MTLTRRLQLIDEYDAAVRSHRPRSHIAAELKALTTKSIQRECRWGWLRKYKPSERTVQLIGLAIGSALYVGGMAGYVLMGMK